MFYTPKPQESSSQRGKAQDAAIGGSVTLLIGLLALLGGSKIESKMKHFYFQNFELIYYVGYGLIAALAVVAIVTIIRRTKDLTARVSRLRFVGAQDNSVFCGRTADGLDVFLPESVRTGHVQILGATGKGKTESIVLPWILRDVARGRNAIVIDGKGDPDLAEKITACCSEGNGADVMVFDLGNAKNSTTINPLTHGTPQQLTDRIMTAFTFDDPYYKGVQADVTRDLMALMQEVGEPNKGGQKITLRRFYELLTSDDVLSEALSKSGNIAVRSNLLRFLNEPRKERDQRTRGLISQIAPFAVGELSALVNGPREEKDTSKYQSISELVLSRQNKRPKVLIFLISTLRYQDIGHQLGKLLLQELGWAVGERTAKFGGHAPFLPVYLDEFSGFVYPGFTNILNKARSAQVALHMSHQSLGDLAQVSDDFATTINCNSNVKCLLGLNDPETADFFARHIGTRKEEKFTERAQKRGWLRDNDRTGEMSIRDVEAYKIHPNAFKEFTAGQGVIHFPTPRGNVSEIVQFERLRECDLPK